ncbi:hypothetical protein M409DRAFT_27120 [Zasmidium cellare ATCC 36951]|uniref:Uncharacterized protein n=1 Tax=Zasmidium cellare ATCC 36951 TaxID=1080233 RepID=A0A6A6C5P7_ZASCE|nr:uncharacterized protein M409DRAFT_27120 [Zasmidium cellare ATCC 36951]KAF2162497.1 hypothetical protein M409DRAFT_27120 [Zasmidium cellare ATCC 36951]
MFNGTSTNGGNATNDNSHIPKVDDAIIQFSRHSGPCKLCNTQLSPFQDLPIHWQSCSNQNRLALKATPSIYLQQFNLAESDFHHLKTLRNPTDVNTEGAKILWILQSIERLGENDYRGALESLSAEGYAGSELKREIIEIVLGNLNRNGNVLSTVLAVEDALHFDSESSRLSLNDRTSDVGLLPYWKVYEVEFLRAKLSGGGKFKEIYEEFVGWDRVKRDALPGKGPLGVAVWLFKLKTSGDAV